ncbi:MAG: hypothetical protein SF002_13710 [Alphaproteobacteria bacterium]|nr:hypothetical protein [Alphaproteobacteria bacterium]
MARQDERFEIQVYLTDHWVTETYARTEQEARRSVGDLLTNTGFGGVRILREYTARNGADAAQVIFTQLKEQTKVDRIGASPIDSAPMCRSSADLLGATGRQTFGRVLRAYLDRFVLTQTEVLYNPREAKKAMEAEGLAMACVSKVAALQAKEAGITPQQRSNQIFDLLNAAQERAQVAASRPGLPTLEANARFATVLASLKRVASADEGAFLAMVVLARDLSATRSWLGKLERLLTLIEGESDGDAVRLIDQVVADVLGSVDGVRDLLGRQQNLAGAILALVDLLDGKVEAKGEDAPEVARTLAARVNAPGLAETRAALLEAACRQLRGRGDLVRGERDQQILAWKRIGQRLLRATSFPGGSRMAEALVLGYLRFQEQGGDIGRKAVIGNALAALDSPADRVRIAALLCDTELGDQFPEAVRGRIDDILWPAKSMNDLTPASLAPPDRMKQVAAAWRAVKSAERVPDRSREKWMEIMDRLLAAFIDQSQIVERLDDHAASLRIRATRLVQFCASDAVTEGRAADVARQRVIGHLRQPNFDQHFVADLSGDADRAKALRDFYALLRRARFEA